MNEDNGVATFLMSLLFVLIAFRESPYPWAALMLVLLHEFAHYITCVAYGCKIHRFSLRGAGMSLGYTNPRLSYSRELVICLSGSAVNLMVGGVLFALGHSDIGVLSIALGAINLLPVKGLDGGEAVCVILRACLGVCDNRTLKRLSIAVALFFWFVSVYCVLNVGANMGILIFSVALLFNALL